MAIEKRKSQKELTVRQPTREMEEIGKYFEDVFGRPFLPASWRRVPTEDLVWAPSIEVIEKEDKFLIKAELPGVKEEDINMSISGNVLTIEGEKKTESETNTKGYYYSESSYGSFSRSMTIPSSIDANKIEANFDNGVLEITLPKTPEVKPKKIKLAVKKKGEAASRDKENTTGKK
jgi:HSP20 family protein